MKYFHLSQCLKLFTSSGNIRAQVTTPYQLTALIRGAGIYNIFFYDFVIISIKLVSCKIFLLAYLVQK